MGAQVTAIVTLARHIPPLTLGLHADRERALRHAVAGCGASGASEHRRQDYVVRVPNVHA
jgi:hypothetical protein